MIDASEVSLSSTINCVTNAGIILRSAWGRITWHMVCARVSPVAVGGSPCPRRADCLTAGEVLSGEAGPNNPDEGRATPDFAREFSQKKGRIKQKTKNNSHKWN